MRRTSISVAGLLLFAMLGTGRPLAQTAETLNNWVQNYNDNPTSRVNIFSNPSTYVPVLSPAGRSLMQTAQASLMQAAEANRTDVQTESSSASAGTTTSVSQGSVPWLFAFAVEHGALTQSVDGNLITLRGNVANTIKALDKKDYIDSYNLGRDNPFVRNVSKASFAFSFSANSGNASPGLKTNTFSSASAHIDFINHRDPRDPKWKQDWDNLSNQVLRDVANPGGRFNALLSSRHPAEFTSWQTGATTTLNALGAAPTDAQIKAALTAIATNFSATLGGFEDVRQAALEIQGALANFTSRKKDVVSRINKGPVLSFEYTFTNQSSLLLPASSTQTVAVKTPPPNLSNLNLIFTAYLVANGQLTLNAATNLFNSTIPSTKVGMVRDYRASAQLDVPLPEIQGLGTSSLSFAALFLALLEEPLGQQVIVNTVPVSTRGNIRLFQAKWTIPMKSAGIRIPVSITSSNRTELIKEKDVRGTIGISFDLDSLFAKP